MGWRYLAQRLTGVAAGRFIDTELPLSEVHLTDTLSGPGRLTGTVPVELSRLRGPDGMQLLDPWSTAIWAEQDGVIRGGGILVTPHYDGGKMNLDCIGYAGYPQGMAYTDSIFFVEADPLDIVRHIWSNLQAKPNGNLGLVVSDTTSTVRIGTVLEQTDYDTQNGSGTFEAGPYKLAWYLTDDLGKAMDDLASSTPFDYHEEHAWAADGSHIEHRLQLYFPRKGGRRADLRFVLGENVQIVPDLELSGDEYANGVLTLGAGEGRDMIHATVENPDGRLRRMAVVTAKAARTADAASSVGRTALRDKQRLGDIATVTVKDHPNAPLGSWSVGDEIRVMGNTGWTELDQWCRIIDSSINPDSGDVAQLTVERS